MKLNKTICLSEEAFKRSLKIENFSAWVDTRLCEPDIKKATHMRRQQAFKQQIEKLKKILHLNDIDCEDARCDKCYFDILKTERRQEIDGV